MCHFSIKLTSFLVVSFLSPPNRWPSKYFEKYRVCFFSYIKSLRATNSLPNVVCRNDIVTEARQSECYLFAH